MKDVSNRANDSEQSEEDEEADSRNWHGSNENKMSDGRPAAAGKL